MRLCQYFFIFFSKNFYQTFIFSVFYYYICKFVLSKLNCAMCRVWRFSTNRFRHIPEAVPYNGCGALKLPYKHLSPVVAIGNIAHTYFGIGGVKDVGAVSG